MGKGASCSSSCLSGPLKPSDRMKDKPIEVGWLPVPEGPKPFHLSFPSECLKICIVANTNTTILTGLVWVFSAQNPWFFEACGGLWGRDWEVCYFSLFQKKRQSGWLPLEFLCCWFDRIKKKKKQQHVIEKANERVCLLKEIAIAVPGECGMGVSELVPEGSNGIPSFSSLFEGPRLCQTRWYSADWMFCWGG